jgi:Zn finger protein HypA/HybF involved in hydrogenase expression
MNVWLGAFVTVGVILTALALRSRSRSGPISCQSCGGPVRLHEPYLMCDSCQRCVGLSVNNKTYP